MPDTLAQKIRAKYPGTYDDLSDQDLETKVLAKYPGVYDDLPRSTASADRSWASDAADVAIGAAKGAGSTLSWLGDQVRKVPGVAALERIVPPMQLDVNLEATNTPQAIGKTVEQIGEFFIPVAGVAGKAAKAAEIAKAGILTAAQTKGDPVSTGVAVGLSAVPGAAIANRMSGALKSSALDTMANSLRATKEWAKVEADRLAPEMLKRGVGGSIKALRQHATAMAEKVGANLDDAYRAAAAEGATVPGAVIRGNLQFASDALHTTTANGSRLIVPGNETAAATLQRLDDFVSALGDDIPVDKAAAIKRQFDAIVSKAGLYGQNAMAPASEKAQAYSFREAANAFRELLNSNPTIEALNKEASFWIGLRDVVDATKLRKVGQTGGGIANIAGIVGASAGAYSGDSMSDRAKNFILGGLAGRQLTRLLQSPVYMNKMSAPLKNALADALASGHPGQLSSVMSRIAASLPAQFRNAFAQ